jgi:uncharacterized protein (TIGR02246 family)
MDGMPEMEARLLLIRQQEAWNRGDAAGYSADVAKECWFTNILGQTHEGRPAFEERHAEIFKTIFAGSRLRMEVLRFRQLTAESAMVEAKAVVTGFRGLPPGVAAGAGGALHTRLLQVLEKAGGKWRVAAYHNVDVKTQEEK